MKHETYQHAQIRLLDALAEAGWTIKPLLKVPQAIHPVYGFTLYFKPQAVYLNQHSLWIDIRDMSVLTFVANAETSYAHRIER